jgi:GNAT superfamily N-acetyltransferase
MSPRPPLLGDHPDDDGVLQLPDGRTVRIGPMGPASRALIEQAMLRLSPESSRRRFFSVRYRLSEQELDDLTGPERPGRLAIGASARWPDGRVEGVGVARFVRVPDRRDVAEVAVTVIDPYQRLGIGGRLLQRLAREAKRRGIHRLSGVVLPDNVPMLALLERHARGLVKRAAGEHVAIEIPLTA